MTLADVFGSKELNLFELPMDGLRNMLRRRDRKDPLDLAYATASCAESGLLLHTMLYPLRLPLALSDDAVSHVEYLANCFDNTTGCSKKRRSWVETRDLCFASSHYGKLQDLVEAPAATLARAPTEVYTKIVNSAHTFVPPSNDSDKVAPIILTLLWYAKAAIIQNAHPDEDALSKAVVKVSDELGLPRPQPVFA